MPRSAIGSGAVDFILSPKEIAREVTRLSKHPFIRTKGRTGDKENEIDNNDPDLKAILGLLYKTHGVDFSQYKMNTIKRRIMRRMLLYKIKSLSTYSMLLNEKPNEPDILYQDLLINVTTFFRDTETHDFLKTTLLPKLLRSKKPDEPLRIWVTACATGQEAYSIAIAILEIQSSKFTNVSVQIFATDLDAIAINKARIGDYSKIELEEVSPKRLQRFYIKSQTGYRVTKQVRDMCVFAQHNLLTDPPFAHLDFVSCCNLLIYLDTAAQKKAIGTFHYALNENGFLMLGKSESIGLSTQLFSTFNKSFKIFLRRNHATAPLRVLTPRFSKHTQPEVLPVTNRQTPAKNKSANNTDLDKAIDAVMLSRYMPASVIINEQLEILQFRGATDLYISPSRGKASLNILKMTRPEIAYELRSLISKSIKLRRSVRKDGIEIKLKDSVRSVYIEVVPLKIEWGDPVLLILFNEQQQAVTAPSLSSSIGNKSAGAAKDRRIKKLEEQLDIARNDMIAFTHEQEAFNEELQSANEEVVSSNEELQSINEELETSKEEIESTNEELSTTNQELLTRNELLNESYIYTETLLFIIPLPLIILDSAARVKSANKAFYTKYSVTEEETEGYRIYDLGNGQWNIPKLRDLLEAIILHDTIFENFEVEHTFEKIGKRIMLLNARRIQLTGQDLILLAIADITDIRNLSLEKERSEKNAMQDKIDAEKKNSELFRFIADAMPQKVWTADEKGNRNYFNRQWLDYTGKTLEELQDDGWKIFIHPEDLPETIKCWKQSVETGNDFEMEDRKRDKDGKYKWHLTRATAFKDSTGKIKMWVGTNTEVEKQKMQSLEFEYAVKGRTQEIEQKNKDLEKMNHELEAFTYISSHDLQEPLRKIQTFTSRLLEKEKLNLSDTSKDYFLRIKAAAQRMQILIQDLLSFSRITSSEIKFELIDLTDIIKEVKSECKDFIKEKNATVETGEMCKIKLIPFQFRQLLQNLLSNALKFSKPGINPHITIDCKKIPGNSSPIGGENQVYHITFTDNGIGFEQHFSKQIFQLFQKLHGKDEYPGTGIGLAIVKKIVENHNGIITAESQLGNGVRIDIYIPE
jgi:two-component system CheB/CheR fusion protein